MKKNKTTWALALVSLSLAGCSNVKGLMDPSININSDFEAFYYLGYHEMDAGSLEVEKRELTPILEDGTGDYFNGSVYGDGSQNFDPSQEGRQGKAIDNGQDLPVHLGLRDAGYSDMLSYNGSSLATTVSANWVLSEEPNGDDGKIGTDFGKTKCLSTVGGDAFAYGYLSKLYNGQMYCAGTHSLSFVSIDETGFSTRLPRQLSDSDYFLVSFRGGSDDRSHDGDTTARLSIIDLKIDLYYSSSVVELTLKDTYVNTDNGGEACSFTGFSFEDIGIDPNGLVGYGISYSNYRDSFLDVGEGDGKISALASDESETHFGLLLYEVMFVDSIWAS